MSDYLSTSDAARILGVSPARVRQLARTDELPVAAVTEGGMRLFLRESVLVLKAVREESQERGR